MVDVLGRICEDVSDDVGLDGVVMEKGELWYVGFVFFEWGLVVVDVIEFGRGKVFLFFGMFVEELLCDELDEVGGGG